MAKNFKSTILANEEFPRYLGMFYATWTAADMTIDFAIGRFLKTPYEKTLILTSGMLFGSKIRLLIDLVNRSKDRNKGKIVRALKGMQGEAKRDVFAHSYLVANENTATFIQRSRGGPYKVSLHEYTLEEWKTHVRKFGRFGTDLWEALGKPQKQMEAFAKAAFKSAKTKLN